MSDYTDELCRHGKHVTEGACEDCEALFYVEQEEHENDEKPSI